MRSRVSSMSCLIWPVSWPIARPPSRFRLLVRARAAPPPGPCCGPAGRAPRRSRRRPRRRSGPRPQRHRRVERDDDAGGQRGEGEDAEQAGSAEQARAEARRLALLAELCLGELDLLAHERRGVIRELPEQLAGPMLAQIVVVIGGHGSGVRLELARAGAVADGLARVHAGRAVALPGERGAVAIAARRLQHPRGGEADQQPPGRDGPGVAAREVLDVAKEPVAVALLQVAAEPLGAVGRLLDVAGRRVLALLAQLIGHRPCVARVRADLLARAGRAPVHLLAYAPARPAGGPTRPVLGLARDLAGLLLCLWHGSTSS